MFLSRVPFPRFIRFWLPVIIWMIVIFAASTGLGSPQNTSRFLRPLLRWFNPEISDATIKEIQFFIRKCAHGTEYCILALLLWRARRHSTSHEKKPWLWSEARFAILLAACYAGTDELHQLFVSTREASVIDVAIDTSGAIMAMLLLFWAGRLRKQW